MSLTLYNTLTRKKEPFTPLDPKNVRMYACGPTVYSYAHIGNARPIIVFDVLFRLLRHQYGPDHVKYVRNITDVDDKINARAATDFPDLPLNEAIAKVTAATTDQFHADIKALGVLAPTVEPRATDHIEEMKALCETLVKNGHAYAAEGHVLFDVASMPDYGKLSNRSVDELEAGARVEIAPYKKSPMDFVLWKPSKDGEPGWLSPCGIKGNGRPGWHIECSAMAGKHLGEVFDIHGGGIDLVFPHHENEVAQSRCAHGTDTMATVWMHNGFLQVEGEKMSKSQGNFITIHDLLDSNSFGGQSWPGDVLRLTMLRTHYRQPIDWTQSALEENLKAWVSIGNVIRDHKEAPEHDPAFLTALSDDMNTPKAFARLFELRDEAIAGSDESAQYLRKAFGFLGFLRKWKFKEEITYSNDEYGLSVEALVPSIRETNGDIELHGWASHFEKHHNEQTTAVVEFLRRFVPETCVRDLRKVSIPANDLLKITEARLQARSDKNWAESDRIRDELASQGINLKDAKDPDTGEIKTTWEIAR